MCKEQEEEETEENHVTRSLMICTAQEDQSGIRWAGHVACMRCTSDLVGKVKLKRLTVRPRLT
jgi:hypothetical protein